MPSSGPLTAASSCSSSGAACVRSWSVLSDDPQDVRLHLGLEPLTEGGPARVHVDRPRRRIAPRDRQRARRRADRAGHRAIDGGCDAMAADVLAGALSRGSTCGGTALAVHDRLRSVRTPVLFAAAAAVLCVACASGGMLWRAARTTGWRRGYAAEQQQVSSTSSRRSRSRPTSGRDWRARNAPCRGISGGGGAAAVPRFGRRPLCRRRRGWSCCATCWAGCRPTFATACSKPGSTRDGSPWMARSTPTATPTRSPRARAHKGLTVEPPRTEQLPESPSGEKAVAFTITGTVAADQPGRQPAAERRAGS